MDIFYSNGPSHSSPRKHRNESRLGSGLSFEGGNTNTAYVKGAPTSTKYVNSKKITIKKAFKNGKEVIMKYENNVLKSKLVN